MAASIASVFQSVRGPRDKLVRGVVTLDNPHGAGGDVLDLSGYFGTAVTGGRTIGDCKGYQVTMCSPLLATQQRGRSTPAFLTMTLLLTE